MVAVLMAHFPFGDLFSCDFCTGISVVFVLAVFAFVLFLVLHARAVLKSVPTKIYAHMRMDCTCVMLNIFKPNIICRSATTCCGRKPFMDNIISAVVIAAYISREIRGWFVVYQTWRKEKRNLKDDDSGEICSPPKSPFFIFPFGET